MGQPSFAKFEQRMQREMPPHGFNSQQSATTPLHQLLKQRERTDLEEEISIRIRVSDQVSYEALIDHQMG